MSIYQKNNKCLKVSGFRIVMDPTLKSRLMRTLKDEISSLTPQLRTAAKYVIDHPADFGLDPIRVTARKADAFIAR